MLFYFVRHGETEANRAHLLAGAGNDHPLTQVGHEQARQLASRLKRHVPHPVHRVYASSMTRARQTAGYLAEELALPIDVIPDLREWHLGEWEGKTFAEFGHLLLGDGEPQRGESRRLFYTRVKRAWQGIHSDDQPYVMVSHGGVWLAMQELLAVPRFKVENCQMVRVRFEPNGEGAGTGSRAGNWSAEIL